MSIQERIRAMNNTLQDDDSLMEASPKSLAVPPKRPTTPQENGAAEETGDMSGDEVMPPKRSSVVDMWRKREGSINRGAAAGRASPVTITSPRKLQARLGASPVSGKPASQVVVGLPSPVQGGKGDDNLDNNAEVYSFDEKKDQALEETAQTSEIKEKNEPVSSNHTILNPVSSGPVNMTYLPARESPRKPPSPANSWSKRVIQQAEAVLPSPPHHETPVGENRHQAQDAEDTNIPKRAVVKDVWTKRAGGEGSFPFNQPQTGDDPRPPKDMPPLPGTPSAGAKPHLTVDLALINQRSPRVVGGSPRVAGGSPLVAGGSPRVAGSSPRTSVRNRWLQRENNDSGRQAGDSSENYEEEEELALISGRTGTGGAPTPTTPRSEAAPATPRTPGGSVVDRWTKRLQTSPGNNNIPSSPVILPSPGAKSDVSGKSPWGDVKAQWTKRGSERDLGKEHLPALDIPSMKEEPEEEQERVDTVGRSRIPGSAGVPSSPRLSMGKLWAKRHSTTESQSNEETGRDNAAVKENPPSGDSRLRSGSDSPSAGVSKRVVQSPSSQLRREALAKKNSPAGVATRESSHSESDVAPRDDQLGSAPKPVPPAASINPKIPIISPRSASKKRIEISNDGTAPSPQAGALSRKMQFKKLGQKHSVRSKPRIDPSAVDQQISEKSERSAPAGVSGPASRNGAANNLPAPLSAVNENRSKRDLKIQTNQQSVNATKASPVAARMTPDAVSAPKTVARQRASPSNAPNRDMKQVLLDKHRQRVNKPGLVQDTCTDDNSVGAESETLSQTLSDIIAEVDEKQLSKHISSAAQRHPQKIGAPAKPSLNVQTLLAFGSEEDTTFDEAGADHVGASCSFDLPYTKSRSPTDASKHAYDMGSDAGASRSSAGGNSLAARATRMMRAKHQYKADERQEHPSDVTETTRRPLVADQATTKALHRPQAKPAEIKPTEPKPYDPKPYVQEHHAHLQPNIERQTARSSPYLAQSRFVDTPPSDSSTVTHTTGPSNAGPSDSVGGNFSFATETDESHGYSGSVSEFDSSPDKVERRSTTHTTRPSDSVGGNFSFATETDESNCYSGSFSEFDSGDPDNGERRSTTPRAGRLDMIADEFVAESNSNADAFKIAYQSLSLEQMANDLTEGVAGTLNIPGLDFSKLSRDLNKGMSAATESLSKLVGKESRSPSKKGQLKIPTPKANLPTEERVAIEVEYVPDSDSE
jgi:hypothetical protein